MTHISAGKSGLMVLKGNSKKQGFFPFLEAVEYSISLLSSDGGDSLAQLLIDV